MADLPSRVVIREEAFEDELGLLIADAEAADEYTAAAEIGLATEPRYGERSDDGPPELWVLPMAPIGGKSIYLLYTFDDAAVVFLGLRTL